MHCKSGQSTPLLNAVNLIKGWHSVSDDDAKTILKDMISELEKQYCSLKSEYLLKNPNASAKILRWFDCLETIAAANLLWSISCSRYNLGVQNPYPIYHETRCQQGISFFPDSTQHQEIVRGFLPKGKSDNASNGLANGHSKGHANGHVSGHANGHTNGDVKPTENGKQLTLGHSGSDSRPPSESPLTIQSLRLQPMDEGVGLSSCAFLYTKKFLPSIAHSPSRHIRSITAVKGYPEDHDICSQCLVQRSEPLSASNTFIGRVSSHCISYVCPVIEYAPVLQVEIHFLTLLVGSMMSKTTRPNEEDYHPPTASLGWPRPSTQRSSSS